MASEDIKRVKVSQPFLDELRGRWSRPVEVAIAGEGEDGDLELVIRTTPDPASLLTEIAEQLEERAQEEMSKRARFGSSDYAVYASGLRYARDLLRSKATPTTT